MDTAGIPLEAKSSVSMVSDKDHQETLTHGKYHKWKTWMLGIILCITIIAYIAYGANKYKESKSNPQTKTTVNSIAAYEAPLISVCPYESKYGTIYPYALFYGNYVIESNAREYDFLCLTSSSGYLIQNDYFPSSVSYESISKYTYSCEQLMDNEYDKDRKNWTLLQYTGSVAYNSVQCWAIIPPKDYQFSYDMVWPFVWIPSDDALQYLEYDNVDIAYIISHQMDFGAVYNIIHPDYIDDWYQTTIGSGEDINDQLGYSTSMGFDLSLWEMSSVGIALYSKTSLSNKVYNHYETYSRPNLRTRSNLQYNNSDGYVIPQFTINIETRTMNGNGDSDGILVHSDTTEYQDYTAFDLLSGIGGIISLVLQGFGVIAGILLLANFVGFTGWRGYAPYPPIVKREQVRLRRFMNKEMKQV